jgi:hypothetical protein
MKGLRTTPAYWNINLKRFKHALWKIDYKVGVELRTGYQELQNKEQKNRTDKNSYKNVRMLQEHPKKRLGNLGYVQTYTQPRVRINFAKSSWFDIGIQHASGPAVEI